MEFDQRMDQKLAVEGFPILGRLRLKPASSVRPNFYGTRNSHVDRTEGMAFRACRPAVVPCGLD